MQEEGWAGADLSLQDLNGSQSSSGAWGSRHRHFGWDLSKKDTKDPLKEAFWGQGGVSWEAPGISHWTFIPTLFRLRGSQEAGLRFGAAVGPGCAVPIPQAPQGLSSTPGRG